MRPTRIFSLTLIASAFALILSTGCKKSSNSSSSGSISATIGSTNFSGGNTQGVYTSSLGIGIYGLVSYNVQGKDTTGFFLTIPSPLTVGKAFSSDSTFLEVDYVTNNGTAYDAFMQNGHAVMTINSLDTVGHKISGVFTATAYNSASASDSVIITNGKFSSSYTVH